MSFGDMVNDCYGAIQRWQEAALIKPDTHNAKTAGMDLLEKSLQEINSLLEKLDLEEKEQDAKTLLQLLIDLINNARQEESFAKLLLELQAIIEKELPKTELPATVSVVVPTFKQPAIPTQKRDRTKTEIDFEQPGLPTHRRSKISRSTVTLLGDGYYKDGVLVGRNYGSQGCAVAERTTVNNSEQQDNKSSTQSTSPTLSL